MSPDPFVGDFGILLREPKPTRPYHRLDYRTRTGQLQQPKAGRDLDTALGKVAEVEAELRAGLGEKGRETFGKLLDDYQAAAKRVYAPS